jgi:hypothetical protein
MRLPPLLLVAVAPWLALTAAAQNEGDAAPPAPQVRAIASPVDTIRALIGDRAHVVAFGEYHQTANTAHIRSALRRFIDELWPAIAPSSADLVVETWISQGNCGKQETAAVADVAKVSQRPAQTESEVVTLIRRAKEMGVRPQILEMSCADYASIKPDGGALDAERMLKLTSDKLESRIEAALARQQKTPPPPARSRVVVYGGALHNDLYPRAELAPFTFGRLVRERTGGGYLEIDLYVPEYIEHDANIRGQPWFRDYQRLARTGNPVLVERAPDSFIVIFAKSPAAKAGGKPAQRARR